MKHFCSAMDVNLRRFRPSKTTVSNLSVRPKKKQNGKLMGIENISDRFKAWRQIMVVETLREIIKKKPNKTFL